MFNRRIERDVGGGDSGWQVMIGVILRPRCEQSFYWHNTFARVLGDIYGDGDVYCGGSSLSLISPPVANTGVRRNGPTVSMILQLV